jgi:5-methylcytosine-specific restriction protein A
MAIGRACRICGQRINGRSATCDNCSGKAFRTQTSCRVCGVKGPTSYCETHYQEALAARAMPTKEREERQPWRRAYRDPAYHRERQGALKRARGACERCGRSDIKLEVDHVVALSRGGKNERGNLVVLCVMCHRAKTAHDRRSR